MMEVKFSVIIPLFNKEKYIIRAIKSILNQTFQNFEIIIVNDGSTDSSVIKISEINDARIKLINQKNSGVSASRNLGVKNSSFDFVTFLDADDTWEPTFLEELYFLIDKYPNMGIYATNNFFISSDNKKTYQEYSVLFNGDTRGIINNYFELFAKYKKSPFSNSNICIPRRIFENVGGYKNGVKLTEDSDLWCRIAFKEPIAYSISPLANYYLNTDGNTHSIFIADEFQVTKTLKKALNDKLIKFEQIKSVEDLICVQEYYLIKRAITSGNKLFAFKKLFNLKLFSFSIRTYIICLLSILVPKNLFNYLLSLRNFTK